MSTDQDLERFVPRHAVALAGDFDARWAKIDGTLCHIDISGFTSLSERLAARGRIGAEELTEVLDSVFGAMLSLVRERGGALLKFGGDALLLLFDGDDHAIQAACAAVEMRAALRSAAEIPTSVGRLALRMSIGLHSGDVHLFRAAGTHRELIVAGPQATTVTEMEETASAGEIVVSSSTMALLPNGSATQKRGNGWLLRWRTAKAEAPGPQARVMGANVSDHVPSALRDHLTHQKADSEHRLATVAFVEFVGIDEFLRKRGGDDTADALDDLVAAVTTIADEEGITFLGTDVDRDAGKIILVSGVPITLVDESGRVLRAARRIVDLDSPFGLKIGINRGHVFSGEVGTEHRSTYTVMGDTVNLAARLMTAAPVGSIYSTASLLDESLTLFETGALEPIEVKGKAEPVAACAVLGETGNRSGSTVGVLPFMGREDEMKSVADAIAKAHSGSGGVVAISGPTGIGKSRLLEEALRGEAESVLDVRGEPYGTTNPYRPFRDPMRQLLGIGRGSNDEMRDSLIASLKKTAPALVQFAPLLGDLVHVDIAPTDATRDIDRRYRQNRVADVAVELLVAFYDGSLIVVAEDTHWADAASLSLIARLARETKQHPWLVITTDRDVPEHTGSSDIRLEPLEGSVVEALVFAATEASPLRPDDVGAVVERSGGNPLFVQELVKAVRETGDIGSLPTSLDGVVGSQIDALEPLARRVLRYVSVLGRSFRIPLAQDLIATQGIELNAATRATLGDFLAEDGSDRLQFRHALVRDVAYEGLSYRRRRQLHLAAGHLVLGSGDGAEDAFVDLLALHFFLGGDKERAWRYCSIAGDHNMEAYANAEAATQFERAIEACRRMDSVSDDDRRETWIKLGDVRERSGEFELSGEAYRQATKLTGSDGIARAEVLFKRARAKERAGLFSSALGETTRARRALDGYSSDEAVRLLSHMLGFTSVIRQAQEKPRLALKAAKETIELAETVQDDLAMARAWQVMDYAYTMLGQPENVVYSQKALDVYNASGELEDEATVLANLGAFAYWNGDWAKALKLYARGQSSFAKAGNLVGAATVEANIGEVLVNQGRFEEAEQPLRDARRTCAASGFSEIVAFVDLLLGRMFGVRGDLAQSERYLKDAIREGGALGQGGFVFEASIHLADAQCRSGAPESGLKTLSEAREEVSSDYFDFYKPTLYRVYGSVLESAGRLSEAIDMLEEGIALADERDDPYEFGLLILTLDRVRHERVDTARREQAEEALRTLGVRSAPGILIRS